MLKPEINFAQSHTQFNKTFCFLRIAITWFDVLTSFFQMYIIELKVHQLMSPIKWTFLYVTPSV